MTVEELNVVISAKTDPIQQKLKELDKTLGKLDKTTQTTTKKMTNSFSKSAFSISKMKLALIGIGIAAAKAGKALFSMGADAATVDNQVVALSKTMGGSSGDFMKWAQDVAVDFGISERAAASFGNQFSSIISRTEKDGAAVAELSQEYLKMGAIIAANTHFEVDDVMGRIRSGLSGRNEAIEDLGIEVKPGVIKGTEAYAAAVRKTGVAWEQMTDAQQASVRTQAILEQAQARYGTELQGTAGKLLVLRAAVDNMKLAWGRAFAPIVDFVIPVIQNLVGWLTVAATYVRAFLGLFFKVEDSVASANKQAAGLANSMGDVATGSGNISSGLDNANKSAKKLQRTLFGFDVIHNVAEPVDTPASGGSGGGIGSIDTSGFELDELEGGIGAFDELNKKIEEAASKIKSFGGKVKEMLGPLIPLLVGVAAGFGLIKIVDLISDGDGVVNVIDDILKKLPVIGNHPAMNSFRNGITSLLGPIDSVVGAVVDLGAKIGTALGFTGSSAVVVGFAAIAAVIAIVVAALVSFYQKSEEFRNIVSTAIQGVIDIFTSLWEGTIKPIFEMIIGVALAVWEQGIKPLWDSFADFIGAIATLLLNIWNSVLQPLVKWFVDVFGPIIAAIVGVVVAVFGALLIAASAIFGAILDILTGLINWVAGFFAGTWGDVIDRIVGFFTGLWNGISAVVGWIWDKLKILIGWVVDTFGPAFKVGLDFVVNVFKNIWNTISGIVGGIITTIKGIITFITGVFTGDWSKAWDGVKGIFSGVWDSIKSYISGVWDFILNLFNVGGKIFDGIVGAISGVFKTIVNGLISGINKVIAAPFKIINGLLNTIRGISVMGVKPFKGLWSYDPLPVPKIPQFATGGFPEDGLFHANSRELVGKFSNGKTAVANNDQIISGVSTGVANAVRGVLGEGMKSDQPINLTVQIGSNTIAKEVINAVDEYTMRTGLTFKTI